MNTTIQVRWKQYEQIFALAVFLMVGLNEWSGMQYIDSILPFLLTYAVPLLLLVLVNSWLLPKYANSRYKLIIFPVAAILCWLILTTSFTLSYILEYEYMLQKITRQQLVQYGRNRALAISAGIVIMYILYLMLREPVISWVSSEDKQRDFRVMLCNRITAAVFLYTGLLEFMITFDLMRNDGLAIFYLFIVAPSIIIVFVNLYGLFPYRHRKQLPLFPFAWKLLIVPFLLSLLSWFWYMVATGKAYFWQLPAQLLILVLIATPISWLLFTQQKEKLASLQQLQKDLGQTTADLAFLRSQINPHFLFNTLNTLYGTALQENAGRTASGIQKLGDMMRFLLHDNHRDQIPLSRELEYLQNYIALQQLRIAQSININIETAIHACKQDLLIAPMLLIPFIENAFKHGIRLTSPSYIRIRFHCDDTGIYLDVVNSLHAKKSDAGMPVHSGVGLQNVRQRLQLIYPGKYSLQTHEDDAAFSVHLHIELPK